MAEKKVLVEEPVAEEKPAKKTTEEVSDTKEVDKPKDSDEKKRVGDRRNNRDRRNSLENVKPGDDWSPKTSIGKRVKSGDITDIDYILDRGLVILEPEVVDSLLNLETDLMLIGQAKGKFGGGQRRIFKQTQKKTMEGNKPQFTTMAVVGDKNGHLGIGLGKAKETVPARDKATRKAKLNIFRIRRGCGSWEGTDGPNSIPFAVSGKCGSVIIKLFPAPKGTGLVCEKEVAKVLKLAGIEDIWSKSFGQTKNKINMIKALEDALKQLTQVKLRATANKKLEVFEGSV